MPGCAFFSCSNHSRKKNKADGITFHAFPTDAMWKHEWVKIVRKQRKEPDWMPNKYHRICSLHFRPEHVYYTNKGLKRISKNAVPYFHASTKPVNDVTVVPKSPSYVENPPSPICKEEPMSPNPFENLSVSESILDSPINSYLKIKLKKETQKKIQFLKENRNLKKKNKILEEKCTRLSETVKMLKKKISVFTHTKIIPKHCVKKETSNLSLKESKISVFTHKKMIPKHCDI